MASLPLSSIAPQLPSFSKFFGHFPPPKTRTHHHHHHLHAVSLHNEETPVPKFDRRNLLMGMGGMYGAANLGSSALATPISGPDFGACTKAQDLNNKDKTQLVDSDLDCCPLEKHPVITNYKLPPVETVRFRPAAHLVSEEYIAKYKRAVALMKALPDEDPRSFHSQAKVHCAYCNRAYEQTGDPQQKLQIHFSWHFYPWHRWYLYFYERILGSLIEDPTFGLPFWNWDNLPPACLIPEMYVNEKSPLYDASRNVDHLPPALADLKYSKKKPPTPPDKIIGSNLTEMYSEIIRNGNRLEDFYGKKYVVGSTSAGMGSVEAGSHTAMHVWVGENNTEGLDMGNFATAGRDSLFFVHHTNIDRLWSFWRDLRGSNSKDFDDRDWLDANYLFYDENKKVVRVYVRDALEHEKMGYTFQNVENPWLNARPKANVKKSRVATLAKTKKATKAVVFPVKLDKVVKVLVDRPSGGKRSEKAKEREEEVLVIEGIEADTSNAVRFEVYVNDTDDNPDGLVDKAEYAGSYGLVPHKKSSKTVKSSIRLGLSELLEDLEIEDDDKILVSLVPRDGGEDITIGGVKITYVDYATGKVHFDK